MGQSPEPGRWTPPTPASSSACWPPTWRGSKTTAAGSRPWPRRPAQLRLAAALVRNVIGPFLDGQPPTPLHVAVVGGAGAGKSTVVNFLAGVRVAEANPQAGYTRHPTAYLPAAAAVRLARPPRLPRARSSSSTSRQPANLDEDVYQVRRVAGTGDAEPARRLRHLGLPGHDHLGGRPATSPRLIEVAALADVDRLRRLRRAVQRRGADAVPAPARAGRQGGRRRPHEDGRRQAGADRRALRGRGHEPAAEGRAGRPATPVLAIPHLPPDELADPTGKAAAYRIPLLNQVLVLADPARRPDADGRARPAVPEPTAGGELLDVARQDLAALDDWQAPRPGVGRREFDERYRTEFLDGEEFRRFDEARDRLLDLLELPGAGRAFGALCASCARRTGCVAGVVEKALVRPAARQPSAKRRCSRRRLPAWLDQLRAEAIRRADSHPLGSTSPRLRRRAGRGRGRPVRRRCFRSFQLRTPTRSSGPARGVTDGLEKNAGGC